MRRNNANHLSTRRSDNMKAEDLWLIGVLAFTILFTASFAWGIWG